MKQGEFLVVSWALLDLTDVIDLTSYKTNLESHAAETSGLLVRSACMTLLGKHLLDYWISLSVSSTGTTMFPLHFSVFLAQFQFLSMVVYFFLSHSYTVRAAWQEGEQIFVLKNARYRKLQPLLYLLDRINSWSISMASWKRWIYIKCVVLSLLFWLVLMT